MSMQSPLPESDIDRLSVFQHRCGLQRTRQKLEEGALTIGFIGGSITDGRTGYNWPEPVINWFQQCFPDVRLCVENAAIGATNSALAVFRAQDDLINRGCDLVFIEYAVNDLSLPISTRNCSREGLIRKMLEGGDRDLVLVYTFSQSMYEEIMAGCVPESIAELEAIGEHYGIGSVWMGLWAMNQVRHGAMSWEEWLPDGIHPQHRGSFSYAQSVMAFLEKELITSPSPEQVQAGEELRPALHKHNWENAFTVPLTEVQTAGPWALKRWLHHKWIDRVLSTSSPGAKLSFEFTGRQVWLGTDMGTTAAELRCRIDGGDWMQTHRERPSWMGTHGVYSFGPLAQGLEPVQHKVEIEVVHGGKNCKGTNFDLALIGVIP